MRYEIGYFTKKKNIVCQADFQKNIAHVFSFLSRKQWRHLPVRILLEIDVTSPHY